MPRIFDRSPKYPVVDIPDWELIARLDQLFRENLLLEGQSDFGYEAQDKRGKYRTHDLDSFRAEVEAQDDVPERIDISMRSDTEEAYNSFIVWMSPEGSYGLRAGHFESTNEATVTHLEARTIDLFERAASRRIARIQAETAKPVAASTEPTLDSTSPQSRDPRSPSWWDKWGVPTVATLVATVVGGLILALIFH